MERQSALVCRYSGITGSQDRTGDAVPQARTSEILPYEEQFIDVSLSDLW